ncbi:MAG: hypothetical protein AMXMBFR84_37360 [Candidatus Hydrogenedentota bacterium]
MPTTRVALFVACLCCLSYTFLPGCASTSENTEDTTSAEEHVATPTADDSAKAEPDGAVPLLDLPLKHNMGRGAEDFTLEKGWVPTDFYGKGEVRIEGDTAYMAEGNDMTGITWTGPLVRMNYEISLEAKRTSGNDFFCGLTFLYGNDPCSFIVGGWGGTCVGISSIDYQDAYNNETARFRDFNLDQWYLIRVKVSPDKIEAWIDEEQMVDVSTKDREIGIRLEVDKSRPLGIATWRTGGAVRNITITSFGGEKPETITLN